MIGGLWRSQMPSGNYSGRYVLCMWSSWYCYQNPCWKLAECQGQVSWCKEVQIWWGSVHMVQIVVRWQGCLNISMLMVTQSGVPWIQIHPEVEWQGLALRSMPSYHLYSLVHVSHALNLWGQLLICILKEAPCGIKLHADTPSSRKEFYLAQILAELNSASAPSSLYLAKL
jgi:hypothetical protein